LRVPQQSQLWHLGREPRQLAGGCIRTAVIDEDDLETDETFERDVNLVDQRRNVPGLILYRDDD
jgi:hypothetical protein